MRTLSPKERKMMADRRKAAKVKAEAGKAAKAATKVSPDKG